MLSCWDLFRAFAMEMFSPSDWTEISPNETTFPIGSKCSRWVPKTRQRGVVLRGIIEGSKSCSSVSLLIDYNEIEKILIKLIIIIILDDQEEGKLLVIIEMI